MADGVDVTAGTGTKIATDERTIASVSQHVQRVFDIGGTGVATGQVVPTATAATLIAARDTRKDVTFYNGTNMVVCIGPATVTMANGIELQPGGALTVRTTLLLQCIVTTATGLAGDVSYVENYES